MKKIKLMVFGSVLALLAVFTVFPATSAVYAASTPKQDVCESIGGCDSGNPNGGIQVDDVIRVAINILSIVVGIAAVIMIIIGGLKYVTSNGDSNAISSAKNTIIYALIGLVIVALAQTLVKFVLNKITKSGS